MTTAVELFFDPVCPFCWVTSRWLRRVERLTDVSVRWRFISLAILNQEPGAYDDKPDLYPTVHGLGRELLRVAAAAREAHGDEVVGPLYEAMGRAIWETEPDVAVEEFEDVLAAVALGVDVDAVLASVGLPTALAAARHDTTWDDILQIETKEALERVGGDVGTPILSLSPPDGPAFFGPVISDDPDDDDALRYWEAFVTLTEMPGFAEVKRGLRSFPATVLTASLAGEDTRAS